MPLWVWPHATVFKPTALPAASRLSGSLPKRAVSLNPNTNVPQPSERSAGFKRLQSTTRLPLESVQLRLSVLTLRVFPAGFRLEYRPLIVAAFRYLPMFHLMDVLPSPRTSHTTPHRGVRSL